jgi:ADP-ribose pyrophosphatase
MPDVQPWELLDTALTYDGYRKIERRTYKLPSGRVTSFDIIVEKNDVSILALTPDNLVILIRQFRPGPSEIVYELPGGGLDRGSAVATMAATELEEETGYVGTVQEVTTTVRGAWNTQRRHILVATDCQPTGKLHLGPNEFIDVTLVSLTEFRELLRAGKVANTEAAYLGLDFLGLLSAN